MGLFFLVGFGVYFMWSSVKALWRRSRGTVIGFSLCASLLAYSLDRALGGGLGLDFLLTFSCWCGSEWPSNPAGAQSAFCSSLA